MRHNVPQKHLSQLTTQRKRPNPVPFRWNGLSSARSPPFQMAFQIRETPNPSKQILAVVLEPISNSMMEMQRAIMCLSKARRDLPGWKPCGPDGTPLKFIIASVRRICAARWHLRRWFAPEGLQPIWARSRLASASVALQTSFICESEIGSRALVR